MLTKTNLYQSIEKVAWSTKIVVLTLLLTALSLAANAQTATVQGSLSSMDVINDTGQLTHGFEIEIQGAQLGDLYYTGYGQRYGAGVSSQYAGGVNVRWSASYDSNTHQYSQSTPQYTPGTPTSWQYCYQGGAGYATSGCENFGQGMRNALQVSLGGSGSVTSSPAGINCGILCSGAYATGTVVTLTATPAAGWSFINWGDNCVGTAPTCTLSMDASKKAKANFRRN